MNRDIPTSWKIIFWTIVIVVTLAWNARQHSTVRPAVSQQDLSLDPALKARLAAEPSGIRALRDRK